MRFTFNLCCYRPFNVQQQQHMVVFGNNTFMSLKANGCSLMVNGHRFPSFAKIKLISVEESGEKAFGESNNCFHRYKNVYRPFSKHEM